MKKFRFITNILIAVSLFGLIFQPQPGNAKNNSLSNQKKAKTASLNIDLAINQITKDSYYYKVEYCNLGTESSPGDFLVKLINIETGQHFDGNYLYRFTVPGPGACVWTGGFTCGLIGNPGCSQNIQVRAEVDWEGRVAETNETNNYFNMFISDYLKGDQTAQKIVNGTMTYVFGDTPFGDDELFDQKMQSSFRMLGYALETLQFKTSYRRWIESFQQSHGLPVSDTVSAEFLLSLDKELYQHQQYIQPYLDKFPVDEDFTFNYFLGTMSVSYVANTPEHPSKDHVRYFMSSLLDPMPEAISPMNKDNIGQFFYWQGFNTIKKRGEIYVLNYIPGAPPYNEYSYGLYRVSSIISTDFMNSGQFIHEYAHHADSSRYGQPDPNHGFVDTTTFYPLIFDMNDCLPNALMYCKPLPDVKVVSDYAISWELPEYPGYYMTLEAFAESFHMYYAHGNVYREISNLDPQYLQQYLWLKDNAFQGIEYCGSDSSLISNISPYWDYRVGDIPSIVADITNYGLFDLLISESQPTIQVDQIIKQCSFTGDPPVRYQPQ